MRTVYLAPAIGTLTVTVRQPGGRALTAGQILADNRRVGGPGRPLKLPAGRVVLGYDGEGWIADPKTIYVRKDVTSTAELVAEPAPARLSLATMPQGADLRLDNLNVGKAPLTVTVRPGRHEIIASLSGHAAKTVTLTLMRGEDRHVDLEIATLPVSPSEPRLLLRSP